MENDSQADAPRPKKRMCITDYFKNKDDGNFLLPNLAIDGFEIISESKSNEISAARTMQILSIADKLTNVAQKNSDEVAYTKTPLDVQVKACEWAIKNGKSGLAILKKFQLKNGEKTARAWKARYAKILEEIRKDNPTLGMDVIYKLASKQYVDGVPAKGRPTLLLPEDHETLIGMMKKLRRSSAKITPLIICSLGDAIALARGGDHPVVLGIPWARGLLERLNWTRRKATTTRKLTLDELETAANEAKNLESTLDDYNPSLVITFDETLSPWCPTDDYTYAPCGTEKISIQGGGDKRGNTAGLSVSRDGVLLPPQLIWSGLTERSIPKAQWPDDWLNCFSGPSSKQNKKGTKWQNEKTMKEYVEGILLPYVKKVRARNGFEEESNIYSKKKRAAFVSDHHWSHMLESIKIICLDNDIDCYFVPEKATDLFSILDIAVNAPYKSKLKKKFSKIVTRDVLEQIQKGIHPLNAKIDIRASRLKPLSGAMIIETWNEMSINAQEIVANGYKKLQKNIVEALELVKTNGNQDINENPALKKLFQAPSDEEGENQEFIPCQTREPTFVSVSMEELRSRHAIDSEAVYHVCVECGTEVLEPVATAKIFKFEGNVHGDDLKDNEVSVLIQTVLKNDIDLPVENDYLATFDDAKGSFVAMPIENLFLEKKIDDDVHPAEEENNEEEDHDQVEKEDRIYCVCKKYEPDDENISSPMVRCDFCGEWYHWQCVKPSPRARMPSNNQPWYCDCDKNASQK
jgi:hypothetical protein